MSLAAGLRSSGVHNYDTTHQHGFKRPVTYVARCIADRVGHILSFGDFAENTVLLIEPRRRLDGNKELGAIGVWARVRHGEAAGTVEDQAWVDFIFESVTDPSRSIPHVIAALNHKFGDDAVKGEP